MTSTKNDVTSETAAAAEEDERESSFLTELRRKVQKERLECLYMDTIDRYTMEREKPLLQEEEYVTSKAAAAEEEEENCDGGENLHY